MKKTKTFAPCHIVSDLSQWQNFLWECYSRSTWYLVSVSWKSEAQGLACAKMCLHKNKGFWKNVKTCLLSNRMKSLIVAAKLFLPVARGRHKLSNKTIFITIVWKFAFIETYQNGQLTNRKGVNLMRFCSYINFDEILLLHQRWLYSLGFSI